MGLVMILVRLSIWKLCSGCLMVVDVWCFMECVGESWVMLRSGVVCRV